LNLGKRSSRPSSPKGLPVDRGIATEEALAMGRVYGGVVRLTQIGRFIALFGVVIAGVFIVLGGGREECFSVRHTVWLLLVLVLVSLLLVAITLLVMSGGAS
jgi:hypothetical protein